MLISKAPAKLILAGEHGVLYHVPAITTSIHWFTTCLWQKADTSSLHLAKEKPFFYSTNDLQAHWQLMTQRHQHWQEHPSSKILHTLYDLPLTVLAWWQVHYPLEQLSCRIDSEIPMGSGLGSSASLIIAMLRGLADWHQIYFSQADFQRIATELEGFAHGRSSGLDVAAILQDQPMQWQNKQAEALTVSTLSGYLVHTGSPSSSTADCVGHVRQHHASNHLLWEKMSQMVNQLKQQIQAQQDPSNSIRQLQTMLTALGIVPQRVQDFTHAIEAKGWAGKQCGAGSISGDAGGFYWLLTYEDPQEICQAFGYPYWSLSTVNALVAKT